jgi:hypothetical protein
MKILGTKYLATVVLAARVGVPFTSRVRSQLPPNLLRVRQGRLELFPEDERLARLKRLHWHERMNVLFPGWLPTCECGR